MTRRYQRPTQLRLFTPDEMSPEFASSLTADPKDGAVVMLKPPEVDPRGLRLAMDRRVISLVDRRVGQPTLCLGQWLHRNGWTVDIGWLCSPTDVYGCRGSAAARYD